MDKVKRLLNNEGIKYIIFGVLTTLINILSYMVLNKIGIYYVVSNAIAFILSVIFAFITNKLYVFNSKNWEAKIVIRESVTFFCSRIASLLIDMLLIIVLIELLSMNWLMAKCLVNIIVIIINYLFSKVIVFKNK